MCLTERQSDEDEDGGGERGEWGRRVSWMRYRARRGELRLTEVQYAFLRRRLNYSQLPMSFMWMCLVSQKQRQSSQSDVIQSGRLSI